MKKISGKYILSATDIKRISAHCRAIARDCSFSGHVSAYFDNEDGEVFYREFVGDGGYLEGRTFEHVYTCYINQ